MMTFLTNIMTNGVNLQTCRKHVYTVVNHIKAGTFQPFIIHFNYLFHILPITFSHLFQ